MTWTPTNKTRKSREAIEDQVAEYLADGKQIKQVPQGQSAHRLEIKKGSGGRARWVEPQRKSHITVAKPRKRNRR